MKSSLEKLEQSIEHMFQAYPSLTETGRISSKHEFDILHKKVRRAIPDWYLQLLLKYPLAEMEVGIPFDYGWDILKGIQSKDYPLLNSKFYNLGEIGDIAIEQFPGFQMIKEGFVPIIPEEYEEVDGYFINSKSLTEKVIYVWHDFGYKPKDLIANSDCVAEGFFEFISMLRPQEDIKVWEDKMGVKLNGA